MYPTPDKRDKRRPTERKPVLRTRGYFFAVFVLFNSFGRCWAMASVTDFTGLSGIYEYVYPSNTPTLIENHYIELKASKNGVTGYYYGTSDDFDEAREGYLPGFFKAPMSQIELTATTIKFTVKVKKTEMWTTPVTPMMKALPKQQWEHSFSSTERVYSGKILAKTIVLENSPFDPRKFVKR
jgi:hypothetical protein